MSGTGSNPGLTLSSASVAQSANLSRRAGLPWNGVLCAELLLADKPHPRTYGGALELRAREPSKTMLVASNAFDLRAAQTHGLRAARVRRPLEYGPDGQPDLIPDPEFQIAADRLIALADQLGS